MLYIVQSTSYPVNDNHGSLVIMVDALRRASAKTNAVVVLTMDHARQDRKHNLIEPITAKLVAERDYSSRCRPVC